MVEVTKDEESRYLILIYKKKRAYTHSGFGNTQNNRRENGSNPVSNDSWPNLDHNIHIELIMLININDPFED